MPLSPAKLLMGIRGRSTGPSPPPESPVAIYHDTSSPSPAEELRYIRREREERRARDAGIMNVNVDRVHLSGDKITELETVISIPTLPPYTADHEQVLLKTANGIVLKVKTALEDYHELAMFLERHFWNVTTMTVRFQFKTLFSSTPLVQSMRKFLRMLASLDREIFFKFAVSLAFVDEILFKDGRDEILEKGLALWVREIYKEISETRKASIEVEGLFSSRRRDNGVAQEGRVPVPDLNYS